MKYFAVLLIFSFLAPAAFAVESYFNQNPRSQYKEPYRAITRQGDNLEAVLLREIKSAKKSVYIAVQEFRLPSLAQALVDLKKAGLDVRVVIEKDYNFDVLHQRPGSPEDGEGSDHRELKAFVDVNNNGRLEISELESRDAIYMLNKGKVPLIDDGSGASMGSALMHHKFVIVDGKKTVVTTANFTMSCIHGDINSPASRGNPNSLIVADSTPMASLFNPHNN